MRYRQTVMCWLASIVLVAGMLAGCAQTAHAPDPGNAVLRAGQGLVVVSLTSNSPRLDHVSHLRVQRLSNGKPNGEYWNLPRSSADLSIDTALFIGAVPAGDYELLGYGYPSEFRARDVDFNRREDQPQRASLSFKVEPDGMADLGRLVMTTVPVGGGIMVGRSGVVPSNQNLLRRIGSGYADSLASRSGTSWIGPDAMKEVEKVARSAPTGISMPVKMDNAVIMPARMGSILLRLDDGGWSVLQFDELLTFSSVLPGELPDVALVGVGEFGLFVKLASGQSVLTPVDPGDLPVGKYALIDGNAQDGWRIAVERGQELQFFHSHALEAGQWKQIHSQSLVGGLWGDRIRYWVWRSKDGIGYATSNGTLHLLRSGSVDWETYPGPIPGSFDRLNVNPDGSIGILTRPLGVGDVGGLIAAGYLFDLEGRKWKKINAPSTQKLDAPQKAADGTLFYRAFDVTFSQRLMQLFKSRNGGETWEVVPRDWMPIEDSDGGGYYDKIADETWPQMKLRVLESGALLYVFQGVHGKYAVGHSSDGGTTWKLEYRNMQ
ncbi:MAG: hypothetical protein KIT73_07075 [Burkholderiales bacterium]|nr:hypothetical protein [Burkholderiales bacterium]